ncbi:MAG: IPT/TIG domain-containing protein, partial [Nitrospirae bacterium]|nr:IPT/TIG domain-containing protein [Nitrospirota bacterium]
MRSLQLIFAVLLSAVFLCPAATEAGETLPYGTIAVLSNATAIDISTGSDIAYSISKTGRTLSLLDVNNLSLLKEIKLEGVPVGLAINPEDNHAFVTVRGTGKKGYLYVVAPDGTLKNVFQIGEDPQEVSINPVTHTVVIALGKSKKLTFLSLTDFSIKGEISLSSRPRLLALDSDSGRLVVIGGEAQGEGKQSHISIIDLSTGDVLNETTTDRDIEDIAISSQEDLAFMVSNQKAYLLDINRGAVDELEKIKNSMPLSGSAFNPLLKSAIITSMNELMLLDINTNTISTYGLPGEPYPLRPITVDPYSNRALIAGDGVVYIIGLPNPVPYITNLIPKSSRAGEGLQLKVEGGNFTTSSRVRFNLSEVITKFKDNENLYADIPVSLLSEPGTVLVTVTNQPPEGGTSEPYPFEIKYPIPVISELEPSSISARSPDFTLKVKGAKFIQGDIVNFNGEDLNTTYISSTELSAVVPSSLIMTKGVYLVTVLTPDRVNSNYLSFTVTDPYPVITDFTPKEGYPGTVVTIYGDNFANLPTGVYFTPGVQASIPSLTQMEIKALVPSGASTGPITVVTSIGNVTSALNFTVLRTQVFELSVSPSSLTMPTGGRSSAMVSVKNTGMEQFSGTVRLSVPDVPEGLTVNFNPEQISTGQKSSLTLINSGLTGDIVLIINGTANIDGTDVTEIALLTIKPIPPGVTTITGRVLRSDDDSPIKDVTLTIDSKTAVTDEAGNFFFRDIPTGEQILIIDGDTANTTDAEYPSQIPVPVTIVPGVDNKLPYNIFLHRVNTERFTPIEPGKETVVKDPAIPDFEMKIPVDVQIIGWDGKPNEKVSVKVVPVDRLPIRPPPEGVYASEIYMYYFDKPGGGTPTRPVPVKMPNNFQAQPGERVELWYYDESPQPDPNSNQWKPFGMGTVSEDGKLIIPDPGVGIPKFCCGASFPRPVTIIPPTGLQPSSEGGACPKGDPVDPLNGMFIYSKNDIAYPSPSMLNITRLYKSDNTTIGPFGRGTSINYNRFLQTSGTALLYITPQAGRYIFSKNGDSSYTNNLYPFLKGVKAYLNPDGTRTLKFADGASYTFNSAGRLIEERDTNGNWVRLLRDSLGNITAISDSMGRTLGITNRTIRIGVSIYTVISSISDGVRAVLYTYDSSARLSSVTMPDGSTTQYAYDSAGRLSSVTNQRGIVQVRNYYDSQGR